MRVSSMSCSMAMVGIDTCVQLVFGRCLRGGPGFPEEGAHVLKGFHICYYNISIHTTLLLLLSSLVALLVEYIFVVLLVLVEGIEIPLDV